MKSVVTLGSPKWMKPLLGCLALMAFALAPLFSAAPTPSDDLSALKVLPANTAAFVHIKGIEGVKDRLFAMLQNALPDYAFLAKTLVDGALGQGFDGRKLEGLSKNGPIFLAAPDFKDLQDDNPNVALIVAVTDYAKFRDGLLKPEERKELKKDGKFDVLVIKENDRTYFMTEKSGFAVVAQKKETASWVLDAKESLEGKVTPVIGNRVIKSDVALYVNMDQGLKSFADQLKEAESSLNDFLKNAAEALPKEQKAGFDMIQKMVGPGFQALRDSKSMVFSVSFNSQGALVRTEVEARTGTETAKFLNGIGSTSFDALGNQPSGQMFYSSILGNESISKMTETFSRGLIGDAKDEETKKMMAAMDALTKAGPGELNGSVDMPISGLTVQAYKDPKAALETSTKNYDLLSGGSIYGNGAIKDKPKVTADAVTHDGIKFTKVEFAWDFEKMFNQGQELPDEIKKQVQNMMKELMGEKMEVYVGVSESNLITLTASDWNKAKAIYDKYKAGKDKVSGQENYTSVRKGMAEKQTMLFLVDPVRYAGKVVEVMKGAFAGMIPLPPGFPANLDKAKSTYLGTGVTLEKNTAALEIYISAASVQEVYKTFVKPFLNQ